ncbi:MAG: class I SAM-dependent methyltransferase [Bdellovibrionales bacterium]
MSFHPIDLWTAEYEMGGIPSSARETPSGAVVWAYELLRQREFLLRTAVDVGCGKGRNSLFLARQGMTVTAMDFIPDAIDHLNQTTRAEGLESKIRAHRFDVTEPWPLEPAGADLVVDAFCFKHIIDSGEREAYKQSLIRTIRMRGHYLISFASIGDGYYGRYVVRENEDGVQLAVDPANGIPSLLFDRDHIIRFFGPELDLYAEIHHNKPSAMHGRLYKRSTYALLFQVNPKKP